MDFSYMNSFSELAIAPAFPYLFNCGTSAIPIKIAITKKTAAQFFKRLCAREL
jgi:hypothetical protein